MKYVLFIVFWVQFTPLLTSQKVGIQYDSELNLESLIPNLDKSVLAKMNNFINVYQYYYINNHSVYYFIESRKKDTTLTVRNSPRELYIYKDFSENVLYKRDNKFPEIVSKEALLLGSDWEILSGQTKNILGYRCIKAVSDKDPSLIAWFAVDLPMLDGPMDFTGLPGMILEIETQAFKIRATNIEILNETQDIKMPECDHYVSPEKLDELTTKH